LHLSLTRIPLIQIQSINFTTKPHIFLAGLYLVAAVAYLDQTGSGNEAAAHLRADGRLTIMFCAFEGAPMILRLYGRGRTLPRGTGEYAHLLATAFNGDEPPGARQIVVLDVESVQTSCGYSVPLYDYKDERPTLRNWASRKGDDGIREYWREKNVASIDGLPTGMREVLGEAAEESLFAPD